jgi:hypothetical protein
MLILLRNTYVEYKFPHQIDEDNRFCQLDVMPFTRYPVKIEHDNLFLYAIKIELHCQKKTIY